MGLNAIDIILIVVISAVLVGAVMGVRKRKKKGGCGCGCSGDCSSCNTKKE